MNIRVLSLALLLCLIAISVAAEPTADGMKPNIIFVLFDDLGYGQPKCYREGTEFNSPNRDCLAREGVRFTDAHSAASVCKPTRYEFHPISGEPRGTFADDRFSEPITLTLKSAAPGDIHYTLDGKDPKTNSPLYAAPITLEQSAKVKAAVFVAGKRQGEPWSRGFKRVNTEKTK